MNRYFLKWRKRAATEGRLKPLKEQNQKKKKEEEEEKKVRH